jgi:hypothetical protein
MRRIATLILIGLALVPLAFAGGKERVTVKVTARSNSNVAYSYAFVNSSYGLAQNINLSGATLLYFCQTATAPSSTAPASFTSGSLVRAMCARAGCRWLTNLKPPSTGTKRSCFGRLV